MLYAKVVLGLPIEGPFDYIVPEALVACVKSGARAWVPFRNQRRVGFIVGTSHKSRVKGLKKILEIIDDFPVLDKNMLSLTREVASYYCCSWGEAIETALPVALRKGKRTALSQDYPSCTGIGIQEAILVHDLTGQARWEVYFERIKETLKQNKSAIIILPDINSVSIAAGIFKSRFGVEPFLLYRNEPKELLLWSKIKEAKASVVIGTRSAVFAPVTDLGLLILNEEDDSVYKQEQVPHYSARGVAFMRSRIDKAKLLLGSSSPSLEAFYLAKKKEIRYLKFPRQQNFPEIKLIDMKSEFSNRKRSDMILSKFLQDSISSCLNSGGKTLLFLNRKGFATLSSCSNCGKSLRCPRCNINLVYHFKENSLNCHYCNFRMEAPKICPDCNAGYIKFSGLGTEKIESELSRIFPSAGIKKLESTGQFNIKDTDIYVATQAVTKQAGCSFDLICVLGIDNSLNRIDLRSSEKSFALLVRLSALASQRMVIQTSFPGHHCFQALLKKDTDVFYEAELSQRKQVSFPPYRRLAVVKLRGRLESRVKESAMLAFDRLKKASSDKHIQVLSVNQGHPSKLRGNFYWQVLVSGIDAVKISQFLRKHLKYLSRSGIIVTVDIDPV